MRAHSAPTALCLLTVYLRFDDFSGHLWQQSSCSVQHMRTDGLLISCLAQISSSTFQLASITASYHTWPFRECHRCHGDTTEILQRAEKGLFACDILQSPAVDLSLATQGITSVRRTHSRIQSDEFSGCDQYTHQPPSAPSPSLHVGLRVSY